MDSRKAKVLVLVEGAKTDVRLMERLFDVYGINKSHQIISYNTNIYVLYNQMFRDVEPETVDLLQLLKEQEQDPQRKKIFDERYSDILLVFDLDPQDPQFSADKITAMMNYFVESSDMGKLYLNYPMVESFYHMKRASRTRTTTLFLTVAFCVRPVKIAVFATFASLVAPSPWLPVHKRPPFLPIMAGFLLS